LCGYHIPRVTKTTLLNIRDLESLEEIVIILLVLSFRDKVRTTNSLGMGAETEYVHYRTANAWTWVTAAFIWSPFG